MPISSSPAQRRLPGAQTPGAEGWGPEPGLLTCFPFPLGLQPGLTPVGPLLGTRAQVASLGPGCPGSASSPHPAPHPPPRGPSRRLHSERVHLWCPGAQRCPQRGSRGKARAGSAGVSGRPGAGWGSREILRTVSAPPSPNAGESGRGRETGHLSPPSQPAMCWPWPLSPSSQTPTHEAKDAQAPGAAEVSAEPRIRPGGLFPQRQRLQSGQLLLSEGAASPGHPGSRSVPPQGTAAEEGEGRAGRQLPLGSRTCFREEPQPSSLNGSCAALCSAGWRSRGAEGGGGGSPGCGAAASSPWEPTAEHLPRPRAVPLEFQLRLQSRCPGSSAGPTRRPGGKRPSAAGAAHRCPPLPRGLGENQNRQEPLTQAPPVWAERASGSPVPGPAVRGRGASAAAQLPALPP